MTIMKTNLFKSLLFLLFIPMLSHCTGLGGGASPTARNGDSTVSVVVLTTSERDSKFLVGKITRFRIALEGEGMDARKLDVSSNAHEVEISNVPAGTARKIIVTAFNRDNLPVREGSSTPFSIEQGETKEVVVKLEAVPVFINVKEGNVVSRKRLVFEILSDPGERLTVEDVTKEQDIRNLISLSNNEPHVVADASGVGLFNPKEIDLGARVFRVKSLVTGRSSQVHLVVTNAELHKPAPLFTAGKIALHQGHVRPTRVGQWSARPSHLSKTPQGELWPTILMQDLHLENSL